MARSRNGLVLEASCMCTLLLEADPMEGLLSGTAIPAHDLAESASRRTTTRWDGSSGEVAFTAEMVLAGVDRGFPPRYDDVNDDGATDLVTQSDPRPAWWSVARGRVDRA